MQHLRHAIERHRMDLTESSAISLLIDVMRDTLTSDKRRRSCGRARSRTFFNPTGQRRDESESPTVSYCALTCLFTNQESSLYENLSNQHLFHELAKLISDGISDISEERVETLKNFVIVSPK